MDHPEKMTGLFGVLNLGFMIVIPIIVALGFFSYFKYGDDIAGTIFLNLPEDDMYVYSLTSLYLFSSIIFRLVQALLILVCIQVLFSYSVQLYAPVTIMWPMLVNKFGPFKRPLLFLLCFRTSLVLLTR